MNRNECAPQRIATTEPNDAFDDVEIDAGNKTHERDDADLAEDVEQESEGSKDGQLVCFGAIRSSAARPVEFGAATVSREQLKSHSTQSAAGGDNQLVCFGASRSTRTAPPPVAGRADEQQAKPLPDGIRANRQVSFAVGSIEKEGVSNAMQPVTFGASKRVPALAPPTTAVLDAVPQAASEPETLPTPQQSSLNLDSFLLGNMTGPPLRADAKLEQEAGSSPMPAVKSYSRVLMDD